MKPDEQQINNWVALARDRDTGAFEALVRHYERYVYNLALRVVNHPQEAEDLSQQAFLRAWTALPRFKGESKFSTWLYRIVTNLCFDRLPHIRRELASLPIEELIEYLPDGRDCLEDAYVSADLVARVHSAVERLPTSYRLLITLRHLQGMSYDEIAQVTGMPLGTVKNGIFRARRQLKEWIQEPGWADCEVTYARV
jgi:RNA polymerase sigma-70 factor (ECF subfamily)